MIGVHLSDVFLMSVNYDLISRMQGCAGITVALRLGNLPGKRTALKAEVPSATAVAHGHELHQYTACGACQEHSGVLSITILPACSAMDRHKRARRKRRHDQTKAADDFHKSEY